MVVRELKLSSKAPVDQEIVRQEIVRMIRVRSRIQILDRSAPPKLKWCAGGVGYGVWSVGYSGENWPI